MIVQKKIHAKVIKEPARKVLDQLLAASNSYLILAVPLLERNFLLLAEISTMMSLYIFWLGLIRIYLVNEVIQTGENSNHFLHYSVRGLKAGITSIPIILAGKILNMSIFSMTLLVLFIVAGIQEELLRQFFISRKESIKALLVDGTWSAGVLIGISLILIHGEGHIDYYIFVMLQSCIISVIVGWLLMKRSNYSIARIQRKSDISLASVLIPISLSIHTFSLNLFLTITDNQADLGLFRALQLFFLPAIFMINIQPNYFKFSQLQATRKNIRVSQIYQKIFFSALVISFLLALSFLFFSNSLKIRNILICSIISGSTLINYFVNLNTLSSLRREVVKKVVNLRIFWLVSVLATLVALAERFILLICAFLILDLILNFFLSKIASLNSGHA